MALRSYGGASNRQIQTMLGINPLDERSVQLADLAIGPHIIENVPCASNMVIVANPPKQDVEYDDTVDDGSRTPIADRAIDLEAVALAGHERQLNHRRFAAVKVTYGAAPPPTRTHSNPDESSVFAHILADWKDKLHKNNLETLEDGNARSDAPPTPPANAQKAVTWLQRCTVLLFRSKRWVCTGATHPDEALMCTLRAASDIRDLYPWFPNPVCEIQNIVASGTLFPLLSNGIITLTAAQTGALSSEALVQRGELVNNLPALATDSARRTKRRRSGKRTTQNYRTLPLAQITAEFGLQGNYRPALFPGAIIRVSGLCFLVFDSGACVITGAKCPRQLAQCYRDFLWNITSKLYMLATGELRATHGWLLKIIPAWTVELIRLHQQRGTFNYEYPPRDHVLLC